MGENSAIAWTDHTFNPWMGCTKVSPACDHCYAEALRKRAGKNEWGDDAERTITSDAYWRNPIKWNATAAAHGVRHRVFCASLADVFEDRRELDEPRERLFTLIQDTPNLDWLLLTKRPQNIKPLAPWAVWPLNVWLGTTVEDQERADERIPHLLDVACVVHFLSVEPLLGPVDLKAHWLRPTFPSWRIDWVIVGGESGAGHRPLNLDAARSIRDRCAEYEVPFFFKQVGGRFPHSGGDLLDGEQHKTFPTSLVCR